MGHRHKSIRFEKSYQKKQIRIKKKQELRKEIKSTDPAVRESEEHT